MISNELSHGVILHFVISGAPLVNRPLEAPPIQQTNRIAIKKNHNKYFTINCNNNNYEANEQQREIEETSASRPRALLSSN